MVWTLDVGESTRRQTHLVASVQELRTYIEEASGLSTAELTLVYDGEPLLVLSFNGDRATLSARRPGTETFFVACDSTQTGPMIEFRMANGQVDEFPPRFIVPRDAALFAVEHLMATRELAPWLEWSAE